MQVYLVSVRTALIYGPGEVLDAQNPQGNLMTLRARWEYDDTFDEWEGYAVVVPEKNQVWGLAKQPELEDQILNSEFHFFPQPIPPKDKRLFDKKIKSQTAVSTENQKDQD